MENPICGPHGVSLSSGACEAEHDRQSLLAREPTASRSNKCRHWDQKMCSGRRDFSHVTFATKPAVNAGYCMHLCNSHGFFLFISKIYCTENPILKLCAHYFTIGKHCIMKWKSPSHGWMQLNRFPDIFHLSVGFLPSNSEPLNRCLDPMFSQHKIAVNRSHS